MATGPHQSLRALVEGARGALKVFPLPGVVVFPGTPMPLHVFEPRYRAMTADALAGDRVMAVATLRDAADAPEDRAPLHPVAGAAVVEAEERLPEGRYNLVLRGVSRVRLRRELDNGKPYREFEVEVLEDQYPSEGPAGVQDRVEALEQAVYELAQVLPAESGASELAQIAARLRSPGRLADLVAAAVVSEPRLRLEVLEALDVGRRLELVLGEVAEVLLVLSKGKGARA
ncbi:MAG TPA: LON peptidase substrate-binding domain-containing protein [Anaeromyxobacteraceae bacterium]|nr:LON peptidase substrate-binding domain-containing protein [Anaeromyxobacteraceae bacterium]